MKLLILLCLVSTFLSSLAYATFSNIKQKEELENLYEYGGK